jgi:SPASM domain peptide maturase of grasp-with-spasm system
MKTQPVYFLLYASCIPVSGYRQTAIYDMDNELARILSNDLFTFVSKSKDMDIETLKNNYKNQYDTEIDELFNYLNSENIGFYTNTPQRFPKIPLLWETPHLITNMILDIGKESVIDDSIFHQIEESGSESLQIRFLYNARINEIENVIQHFYDCRLHSIELILIYNPIYKLIEYRKILSMEARIASIHVFSSPYVKSFQDKKLRNSLAFLTDNFHENNCGQIKPYYFRVNTSLFTESHHYNTCLNCKLHIDANGNIKNCPAMQQSFGNIKTTTLKEVISKQEFKQLWNITKDKIDVCKDCEFRYMCTDCRCFIKDTGNIYSQPAKCTYNPYICKWEGEDDYVSVEECGTYSKETGFIPDKKKISKLNKQIWREDE